MMPNFEITLKKFELQISYAGDIKPNQCGLHELLIFFFAACKDSRQRKERRERKRDFTSVI